MKIPISEESTVDLDDYARIRMCFDVRRVLNAASAIDGSGGFIMSEVDVPTPYLKDYDAVEDPRDWPRLFDVSNWGFFAARLNGQRVGGAVVAIDTPGLTMLEGRKDLAVLWDIRVAAEARRHGIGAALFAAAERWAMANGMRRLKVETQNINVPACRFYAKQGCVLGAIHPFAYPDFPDETQLLWYKDLSG